MPRRKPQEKGLRSRFEFFACGSIVPLPIRAAAGFRVAAAWLLLLVFPVPPVMRAAPDSAAILWRGETHSVALVGSGEFRVADAAQALGFEVKTDAATGVLTLSGHGHQVFVGVGTAQVPVDQRIVQISRPARSVEGFLYAPADFFEKVLFPLVGATAAYDPAKKLWTLTEGAPPLTLEVAVVHVAPTTQIVMKHSAPPRFVPSLTETGFQIRWPGQKTLPPFVERRYEDPLVSAIRFAGDTASIEFREPGLTARAYPLTAPDRIVIEIGREATETPTTDSPAPLSPAHRLTIVIDPGHGGTETGAIGPGGLQEKDVTLQIARRLAASISRMISCRTVLTRDSDSAISLDDRTAVANHEKAELFLSVHANSSRAAGARGSETYYLSLEASDKLAQEVASRENQNGATGGSLDSAAGSRGPDLNFILWDLAQSAHLKDSSALAEAIQEELNVVSRTENRGIKQAPFRVLVGATMPAVLVEAAFISNAEEEKKLASAAFQQSVADAVARAVSAFFARRRSSRPITTPAPAPLARTPTPPVAASPP